MNIFELYTDKILNTPLYIKQIIYLKLANQMRENFCENLDNIFAAFIPALTFKGNTELEEKKCGLDNNIYKFLQFCKNGYSIAEICVNSFLSMEETAKYFEFCIENNFLETPQSKQIQAIAGFISGKFRIGEYLEHAGIITAQQLQTAINKADSSQKFGEILISLDLVSEKDLKALLILKEEAKKRFILDHNLIPKTQAIYTDNTKKFEDEIEKLRTENFKLKQQMQNILKLVREEK